MNKRKTVCGPVAGYGAAFWALIFSIVHFLWAAGWYVGLRGEGWREAFERPWFYVYNLFAAGMCAVAVPLALGLTRRWERVFYTRLFYFFGWSATLLLTLRGILGVINFAYLGISGNDIANPMFLWDMWFCLGGSLFGLATWYSPQISMNTDEEKI